MKYSLLYAFCILSLFSCKHENKERWHAAMLEQTIKEENELILDDALSDYSSLISSCYEEKDSLDIWTEAIAHKGRILQVRKEYVQAKECFKNLLDFASQHGITKRICLANQRLGEIALLQHDEEEADRYFSQALVQAQKLKKKDLPLPYLYEEAAIAKAYVLAKRTKLSEKEMLQTESVAKILRNLTQHNDLYLRTESYRCLADMCKNGVASEKTNYLQQHLFWRDSLERQQTQFFRELSRGEKARQYFTQQEKDESRQKLIFIALAVLVLALCGSLAYVLHHYYDVMLERLNSLLSKRTEEFKRDEHTREEERVQFEKYMQLEKDLKERMKQIAEQEKSLEKIRENLQTAQMQLQEQKKEITHRDFEYRKNYFYGKFPANMIPHEGDLSEEKIAAAEKLFIKEENSYELIALANLCFENYADRLREEYPKLSLDDLLYCIFFKLGIRPVDIARMMCVQKNTPSMRRQRLTKKLNDPLEEW